VKGNIRKMQVELSSPVSYHLPVGDELLAMNTLIGKNVELQYHAEIHCVACGRKTKKSFAQGYCYPCFRDLAECDLCIMKPETCHYVAGTCRQPDWGLAHCMQAHYVYLANSSGVKVGITRGTQIPTRWIDQGAGQALPIFKVQTRLQSGLLEVELKKHVSDRTDWRKMLKGEPESIDLSEVRDRLVLESAPVIESLKQQFGEASIQFLPDTPQVEIQYPVEDYPLKLKSLNFDKQEKIAGVLLGIKGQYLILDCGVLNIRKFSGYNISVSMS
jgi:hypothetical protein